MKVSRCEGYCIRVACSIGRSCDSSKDLSWSIYVGTRKMVNYACTGRSQEKFWWRLAHGSDVQIDR